VVLVHRIGAAGRVLNVRHRRDVAPTVRQRLVADRGHARGGRVGALVRRPLEVVLVDAEHAVVAHGSGSIPTIARNSSVLFTWGNGSLGTGRPSFSQIGSQPSPGCQSIKRSGGTDARTSALCASYARFASLSSRQFGVKRFESMSIAMSRCAAP